MQSSPAEPAGYGVIPPPPYLSPVPAPVPLADECRRCGATPAVAVKFRQVIGLVLIVRTKTVAGMFCRDCGIALGKQMTRKSMMTGWIGIVAPILNVISLVGNNREIGKLKQLADPVRSR